MYMVWYQCSTRHPGYIGTQYADSNLYIFMEYIPGGCLSSIVKKFGPLNESVVRSYTEQILQGLAYLHSHNIVHRDLKGANILVDANGGCKLADFGASKRLQDLTNTARGCDAEQRYDICISIYYMCILLSVRLFVGDSKVVAVVSVCTCQCVLCTRAVTTN
jgi:serine/threonine protein kinase